MRVNANNLGKSLPVLTVIAALQVGITDPAAAQSLTPMRGEVRSTTDQFAIRVFPANPYKHRISVEIKVYDETFAPIRASVMPAIAVMAPEDNRGVLVLVPFEGRPERRVRICAESIAFEDSSTRLRTQVCGRFLAHRVQ